MTRADIEAQIRRRADFYLSQPYLTVDYYRIRRRVAYPLPLRSMPIPAFPVPGIPTYPWATWMSWELEERIGYLGWAAEWFGDDRCRETVLRDLDALAEWPTYGQYRQPDLSTGHAARTLWSAYQYWTWLGDPLRRKIESAFERIVRDVLPLSDEKHGAFNSKADILALPEPHTVLHNITFIGTTAPALAAGALGHPAADKLNRRLAAILGAILDLRPGGHSEAVGYDGYTLDFAALWLESLPEKDRAPLLDHPRFGDLLDESLYLSVPGDISHVAEHSDVEPKEMPFHMTAHARTHRLRPTPRRAWYLSRCRTDWMRADALAQLHPVADDLAGAAPPAGALDAHYAVALRSGYAPDDLAVVLSTTSSPMSHVQKDNGSLVLGTRGRWLISDPGYQQYMKKQEREFTLGVTAHNAPVLNGRAQTAKLPERHPVLQDAGNGLYRAELDLTPCYSEDLNLDAVVRTVWLSGRNLVVADRISGPALETVSYAWHGHPEAAWWAENNLARICLPDLTLWLTSPQAEISTAHIDRVPGSRGQLTLLAQADAKAPVVWWVFSLGNTQPEITETDDKRSIRVNNASFTAG